MTDDLDDLKAMMGAATPRPDAARRAENLALAQKNFNDLQGSREPTRPTPETGRNARWTGVWTMLKKLTPKAALTTTTAVIAVGFLAMTPQMQELLRPPSNNDLQGIGSEPMQTRQSEPTESVESTPPTPIAPEISPETIAAATPPAMAEESAPAAPETDDRLPETEKTPPPTIINRPLRSPMANPPKPSDSPNIERAAPSAPAPTSPRSLMDSRSGGSFSGLASREAEQTTSNSPNSLAQNDAFLGETVSEAPMIDSPASPPPSADEFVWSLESDIEGRFFGDLAPKAEQFALTETTPGSAVPSAPVRTHQSTADGAVSTTQPNTESFPTEAPSALKITAEEPVSTFSIDVDTASYGIIRSSLTRGQLPPAQAVRIEEMINYFPYNYPAPDAGDAPFRPTVSSFQTPWNEHTQLVHIALQGQMPAVEDRPPLNLTFLIDTSGSMDRSDKLPLLIQSFRLMLSELRPQDQVAIVTYAGSAGLALAPTPAGERAAILNALNTLRAGGGTNGQGGLQQAYSVAKTMAEEGEVSRIILATDGDFNIGISNPDALKDFISDQRDSGTYLSVLGFGRGNLDDATMQALAQNGNGTAAYIDTLSEAQKVLVDQLSGALFPIAGDVKVQVEFNPAQVAEYRLIGYETRALNREDFNNDKVDAGELGAGHAVTALYEITPVGSPAQLTDPLRYQPSTVTESSPEIGYVKLRYKAPGESSSQLIETPVSRDDVPGTEANFAAAIAGFGQLLRNDSNLGDWGYDGAIALANNNRGEDPFGYRSEAVQLMRLAQSLSR